MLSVCSADRCVGEILFVFWNSPSRDWKTRWFCAGIFGILEEEVCPRCGLLLFACEAGVRPAEGTWRLKGYRTGLSLVLILLKMASGEVPNWFRISGPLRHCFLLWRLWR